MVRRPAAASARKRPTSTIEKALRVIETIASAPGPIAVGEIERRSGLPRATAHRIVNQLIKLDIIKRDPVSRNPTEGDLLVSLALRTLRSNSSNARCRDILTDLTRETREASHFGILRGSQVLLIDSVDCPELLGIRYGRLTSLPLHATATGKLLMALMPTDQRDRLVASLPLPRLSDKTITDRRKLQSVLAEVQGVAVATEDAEHIAGVVGVSVPVFGSNAEVMGAVCIIGPQARCTLQQAMRHVPMLRAAAERVAAVYRG